MAAVLGGLLSFAFAPYDLAYLVLLAMGGLYWIWQDQTPRQAFGSGYWFGLGLFAAGLWWVYISIHDFGGADPYSASFLTALLVAVWAIFPALCGYATAWLAACSMGVGWRIASAALAWVFVEYIRGDCLLNGFPWLQLAYSQLSTPLAGFSPLLGVYGVGFVVAISAFSLVEMGRRKLSLLTGLALLISFWGLGAWLRSVSWTHPAGAPIKVTLVQGNISQDQKWQSSQKLNTLNLYRQLTEQHWDADVIVWPETSIPAFLSQVQAFYIDPLAADARQHGVDLVLGLPSSGQGDDYYNSVLAIGEQQMIYHKNHLLPFGEYLPLQPLSGWILDRIEIPLGSFAAGEDKQPLLSAGGHAFVTTICYEDVFGEQVIRQIEAAAYIVNVTNDAWFGDSAQPYQHMQMAQMRALETGRYLVRATNTGLTGFVGPDGRIRQQAPLFVTTTLTDDIVPMLGMTPYAKLGNQWVMLGLLGFTLSVLLLDKISIVKPRRLD